MTLTGEIVVNSLVNTKHRKGDAFLEYEEYQLYPNKKSFAKI